MPDMEDPARVVASRSNRLHHRLVERAQPCFLLGCEQPTVEEAGAAVGGLIHPDEPDQPCLGVESLRQPAGVVGPMIGKRLNGHRRASIRKCLRSLLLARLALGPSLAAADYWQPSQLPRPTCALSIS